MSQFIHNVADSIKFCIPNVVINKLATTTNKSVLNMLELKSTVSVVYIYHTFATDICYNLAAGSSKQQK